MEQEQPQKPTLYQNVMNTIGLGGKHKNEKTTPQEGELAGDPSPPPLPLPQSGIQAEQQQAVPTGTLLTDQDIYAKGEQELEEPAKPRKPSGVERGGKEWGGRGGLDGGEEGSQVAPPTAMYGGGLGERGGAGETVKRSDSSSSSSDEEEVAPPTDHSGEEKPPAKEKIKKMTDKVMEKMCMK